jgi:hypothetical protein
MTYTRAMFGKELKDRIIQKEDVALIGHWAFSVYMDHIDDIDLSFRDILLTLNAMEDGPEFAFSYEELEQIADDLIAGKDVKL